MTFQCDICGLEELTDCKFTVTFARHNGGWLFSRHQARDTWETQGGHIEPGEAWEAAALRELYEESGAVASSLTPICGYWASSDTQPPTYGIVYLAQAERLGPLPESEIAEVRWFEHLPANLTYPDITPKLFARVLASLEEDNA